MKNLNHLLINNHSKHIDLLSLRKTKDTNFFLKNMEAKFDSKSVSNKAKSANDESNSDDKQDFSKFIKSLIVDGCLYIVKSDPKEGILYFVYLYMLCSKLDNR